VISETTCAGFPKRRGRPPAFSEAQLDRARELAPGITTVRGLQNVVLADEAVAVLACFLDVKPEFERLPTVVLSELGRVLREQSEQAMLAVAVRVAELDGEVGAKQVAGVVRRYRARPGAHGPYAGLGLGDVGVLPMLDDALNGGHLTELEHREQQVLHGLLIAATQGKR
jgi:hypothetical protein